MLCSFLAWFMSFWIKVIKSCSDVWVPSPSNKWGWIFCALNSLNGTVFSARTFCSASLGIVFNLLGVCEVEDVTVSIGEDWITISSGRSGNVAVKCGETSAFGGLEIFSWTDGNVVLSMGFLTSVGKVFILFSRLFCFCWNVTSSWKCLLCHLVYLKLTFWKLSSFKNLSW